MLTRLAGTEAHHAYWVACVQAGETSPWRWENEKEWRGGGRRVSHLVLVEDGCDGGGGSVSGKEEECCSVPAVLEAEACGYTGQVLRMCL